ncbi:MAG TPA: hypothetical protein VNT42_02700 [Sphingomonas sp.]|nr:hypothetical protein [Sphingomonas sp.]
MSKRPAIVAILAFSAVVAQAAAADPAVTSAPAASAPPAGAGLTLINERCGFCHTTTQIFSQRKSPAEWAVTVQTMADRGAEVSPEEIRVISDYLGLHFAPATPAAPAHH